jgi:cytochrome P450
MSPQAGTITASSRFNPVPLRRVGNNIVSLFALWLLNQPAVMSYFRTVWRIFPLPGGIAWITQYDDVLEALSRPDVFQVPFGCKMEFLVPTSCPFILSVDGGDAYRRGLNAIMKAFPLGELDRISRISAQAAEAIMDAHPHQIDAVTKLMLGVPVQVCCDYYGLDVSNCDFGLWLIAISDYVFTKIGKDKVARAAARPATDNLIAVVDAAIDRVKAGHATNTIVGHFVTQQQAASARGDSALPADALLSTIVGMTVGYVAVAVMAGGHILEVLLRREDAMTSAVRAARDDNDELLTRCLLEALRFYPINPGPWRICHEDYTFTANTWGRRRIRQGTKVLVGTQSAMRDPRRVTAPGKFDPYRNSSDSMVFGTGLHWCVGAPLAIAQMTQTFKPLLRRAPVRRAPGAAGRTRYFGSFPEHLTVTYGDPW